MRAETGCALVMVGRAALGDPWIFSGRAVSPAEAARFLLDYGELLRERSGVSPRGRAGRIKQLLRHWVAGGLLDALGRESWLSEPDPDRLFARLAERTVTESTP